MEMYVFRDDVIEKENDDINYSFNENQLNKIINFINENFIDSTVDAILLNNYKLLLKFIRNCEYIVNIVDAEALFLNCPILKDTIKTVIEYNISKNPTLKGLFDMYDVIEFERIKDNENKVSIQEVYDNSDNDESLIYDDIINGDIDLISLYYNDIGSADVYSREKEIEMFQKYHSGSKDAYDDIIIHNLKFVVHKAKKYIGKGLPLGDLIQEGNIGLIEAVSKFDETRGYKFSTYSAWWIENNIKRAIIEKVRGIKLPTSVFYKEKNLFTFIYDFQKLYGRTPTYEEIEDALGIDKELCITLYNLHEDTQSINMNVYEDNKDSLSDVIIDENSYIDEYVIRYTISKLIRTYIMKTKMLSKRDKNILYYRFDDCLTLDEIAKIYGLTKEGVRFILNRTSEKLKKNNEFLELVPYEYKKEFLKRKDIENSLRYSARVLARNGLK